MAPGSEKVIISRNSADVANCKALGNFDLSEAVAGTASARNHADGLGGDTVLDTTPTSIYGTAVPFRTGVVYRCGGR
jgi:hypothetical protein